MHKRKKGNGAIGYIPSDNTLGQNDPTAEYVSKSPAGV